MATRQQCPWTAEDVERGTRTPPGVGPGGRTSWGLSPAEAEAFAAARNCGYLVFEGDCEPFALFRAWWDWTWAAGHPFVAVCWRPGGWQIELDLTTVGGVSRAGAARLAEVLTASARPGAEVGTGPVWWGTTVAPADADLVARHVVDLVLESAE